MLERCFLSPIELIDLMGLRSLFEEVVMRQLAESVTSSPPPGPSNMPVISETGILASSLDDRLCTVASALERPIVKSVTEQDLVASGPKWLRPCSTLFALIVCRLHRVRLETPVRELKEALVKSNARQTVEDPVIVSGLSSHDEAILTFLRQLLDSNMAIFISTEFDASLYHDVIRLTNVLLTSPEVDGSLVLEGVHSLLGSVVSTGQRLELAENRLAFTRNCLQFALCIVYGKMAPLSVDR